MFFTYVVRSEVDGRFYVGLTADVVKRVKQHNSGYNRSTKAYTPWALFFFESFETRSEAREREVYLKSGIEKEFIKEKWSFRSINDNKEFQVEYRPGSSAG